MMGTVWLRLSTDQESIIPLTNAIVSTPTIQIESGSRALLTIILVLWWRLYELHGSSRSPKRT